MFKSIGMDVVREIVKQTTVSMASASTSYVLFIFLFMMDRLLAIPAAKLYFVLGYIIFAVIFYSFGVIVFPKDPAQSDRVYASEMRVPPAAAAPTAAANGTAANASSGDGSSGDGSSDSGNADAPKANDATSESSDSAINSVQSGGGEDDDDGAAAGDSASQQDEVKKHLPLLKMLVKSKQIIRNLLPFNNSTHASFYNFSIGYLAGYWSNLNLQKQTSNALWLCVYYMVIAFLYFVFSVFMLDSCSWKSGLISNAMGMLVGMLWSQLVYDSIDQYERQIGSGEWSQMSRSAGNAQPMSGGANVHRCENTEDDDVVCKAFRM